MLIHGDALVELQKLETNSVDAICCDPPSAINFMNKSWDSNKGGREAWIGWLSAIMAEGLRVLKPGGHAFVWALPRTSHWTAIALEDAGYEIRDKNYHVFGQGFPKSHNVGKATKKLTGKKSFDGWGTALKPSVEEWILCRKPLAESNVAKNVLAYGTGALNIDGTRINPGQHVRGTGGGSYGGMFGNGGSLTADPAGHDLGRWPSQLLLTHLPSCTDDICVPECPIAVMDAQSGMRTSGGKRGGEKRIDECGQFASLLPQNLKEIEHTTYGDQGGASRFFQQFSPEEEPTEHNLGRWPSQLLLSHSLFCTDEECHASCPTKIMDAQSGKTKSSKAGFHGRKEDIPVYGIQHVYHKSKTMLAGGMEYGDEGGASRYFQTFDPKLDAPFIYTPKASLKDKTAGGAVANHHPTTKSTKLMQYLVRMITPPDGLVLDMFAGSGSTLVACIEEGFRFIGIEQEEEYIQVARARVEHALKAKEASIKSPR